MDEPKSGRGDAEHAKPGEFVWRLDDTSRPEPLEWRFQRPPERPQRKQEEPSFEDCVANDGSRARAPQGEPSRVRPNSPRLTAAQIDAFVSGFPNLPAAQREILRREMSKWTPAQLAAISRAASSRVPEGPLGWLSVAFTAGLLLCCLGGLIVGGHGNGSSSEYGSYDPDDLAALMAVGPPRPPTLSAIPDAAFTGYVENAAKWAGAGSDSAVSFLVEALRETRRPAVVRLRAALTLAELRPLRKDVVDVLSKTVLRDNGEHDELWVRWAAARALDGIERATPK